MANVVLTRTALTTDSLLNTSMFRCRFIPLTQEPHFPYNFDHNDEDLDQEAIRNCLSEQRVVLAKPILIPFPYVLVR